HLDEATGNQLQLAIEEAVVNEIDYAYPQDVEATNTLHCTVLPDRVIFELIDQGIAFDPTATDDPDLTLDGEQRPVGGLGILLTKKLMDEVTYQRKDGQNHLRLVKIIPLSDKENTKN
ncbi:MAG: ATP-binding protein, partial [Bacteroidaceae bacterium]|nr:ATP-binding protein [Bacteroidaceae bacterium]